MNCQQPSDPSTVLQRHTLSSLHIPCFGTLSLVVEVEDGFAWISVRSESSSTSFDRFHWSPSSGWQRREIDPRGGWPHFSTPDRDSVAKGLLMYVGAERTEEAVSLLSQALEASKPSMEAAIVMDS